MFIYGTKRANFMDDFGQYLKETLETKGFQNEDQRVWIKGGNNRLSPAQIQTYVCFTQN